MEGWIYSYADDCQNGGDEDSSGEDSLPVSAGNIVHGAKGGREVSYPGATRFKAGAAEAFQLSSVSVQMVAVGKSSGGRLSRDP